jgi:hypothetical protein
MIQVYILCGVTYIKGNTHAEDESHDITLLVQL